MMGRDCGGGEHEATLGRCLNMACNVGKTLGEILKRLVFLDNWGTLERH